jgi:hypothetical protein
MTTIDKVRRRVNRVSKMDLDELSVVDEGANGLATILLKSRGGNTILNFEPILITKAADAEPDEDEPEDGADEQDEPDEPDEREAAAARRNRRKALAKMVRRKFALAKASGDDEGDKTSSDPRSAAERSADMAAVTRAAIGSPPAASETFLDWAGRVFGAQLKRLDTSELHQAQKCFDTMRQGTVLKAKANDTIMEIAKAAYAADPSRGLYVHWAAAAKQHPELYSAMRAQVPVAKSAENRDYGYWDQTGGHGAGFEMIDQSWGGDGDAEGTALDQLNKHATEIMKSSMGGSKPLTQAQSFVRACQTYPDLFAAYKRGG